MLTLIDSTVSGNVAAGAGDFMMGNGGGIGILAGEVTIINSTVSGNRAIGEGAASGLGGGLWVSAAVGPGSVTLLNSTVSDNMALSGGGGLAAMSLACLCGEALDPMAGVMRSCHSRRRARPSPFATRSWQATRPRPAPHVFPARASCSPRVIIWRTETTATWIRWATYEQRSSARPAGGQWRPDLDPRASDGESGGGCW